MKALSALAALMLMATADYHLLTKYPVPGDGWWDYLTLDTTARRLYVSHGTKVDVLDADQGTVIGAIVDTAGVHGIAVASQFNRGFASCGTTNEVVMFDLKGETIG